MVEKHLGKEWLGQQIKACGEEKEARPQERLHSVAAVSGLCANSMKF